MKTNGHIYFPRRSGNYRQTMDGTQYLVTPTGWRRTDPPRLSRAVKRAIRKDRIRKLKELA